MNGKQLGGTLRPNLRPTIVDFAQYRFEKIEDLIGPFKGQVKARTVSITYNSGKASITGAAQEGDFDSCEFEGEATLGN